MNTIIKIAIATGAVLLFTACGPKLETVAMAKSNTEDPRTSKINTSDKADLFIHMDWGAQHATKIIIDNKVFDSIVKKTYAYYELAPGRHWIAALGYENSSFICKQFNPNQQYIYMADMSMGMMDGRVKLKESSTSQMDKDVKQIFQKNKKVTTPLIGTKVSSISVQGSGNKNIAMLASKVQNRLQTLSISNGNSMVIKLSLLSKEEGNQFGRYMFGGMDAADKYKSSVTTKAEFYIGNKKVDEFISYKELGGGIFGGSGDSLSALIADEITSYLACKYYGIQYPATNK